VLDGFTLKIMLSVAVSYGSGFISVRFETVSVLMRFQLGLRASQFPVAVLFRFQPENGVSLVPVPVSLFLLPLLRLVLF
jgi:hypothetical protein